MKIPQFDGVLQSTFRENDMDAILKEADHQIMLDDCADPGDAVGSQVLGIKKGFELYELLLEVRKIESAFDAGIYLITFDDYADDDAVAFFIGTHAGLMTMFKANPAKEEIGTLGEIVRQVEQVSRMVKMWKKEDSS